MENNHVSLSKWTKFADGTPSVKSDTSGKSKIAGSMIIVKYASGVEAYGEWGTTFRDGIYPNAKWYELPNISD